MDEMEHEDEYVTGMSGATRTRVVQRNYAAEGDTITRIGLDAQQRMEQRRQAMMEARNTRMVQVQKEQREAALKESGLTRAESVASDAGSGRDGGRDREFSIARGQDGAVMDARTVTHAQYRELKDKIMELEEKYRKAMVQIAQLDNEKQVLIYRVDLYQDRMEEQEERTAEYQRLCKEKTHNLNYQKRLYADLETVLSYHKAMLKQRDEIITAHGFVFVGGELVDDEEAIQAGIEGAKKPGAAAILSQKAAALLEKCGEGSLEGRLRKFAAEKEDLREQIRKLKADLDSARGRGGFTSLEPFLSRQDSNEFGDTSREVRRQLDDTKSELDKSQHRVGALEETVAKLEAQLKKYRESRDTTPSKYDSSHDRDTNGYSSFRRSTSRSRATTPSGSGSLYNGATSGSAGGVTPIYETSRRATTSLVSDLPPSGTGAFRDRSAVSSARDSPSYDHSSATRSDRKSASRSFASSSARSGSLSRYK